MFGGRATLPSFLRRISRSALRFAAVALFLSVTQADGDSPPSGPTSLLFWSGYEGSSALGPVTECSGWQCLQYFTGTDDSKGLASRSRSWPASLAHFQLLAAVPVNASTIETYMVNRIESGTGRNGSRSLYSEIKRGGCCGTNSQGGGATQNPYLLEPVSEQGDMYLS